MEGESDKGDERCEVERRRYYRSYQVMSAPGRLIMDSKENKQEAGMKISVILSTYL